MNKVQNRSPPFPHHVQLNKPLGLNLARARLASVFQPNGVSQHCLLVP